MLKRELLKVEGDKIVRLRKYCPKCGEGVYLADHKDRLSCGKCGYTEFKGNKPAKTDEAKKEKLEENQTKQEASPEESEKSEREGKNPSENKETIQ